MNILILSGSRDPKGQTARAIDALCKGIADGGATAETIFLPTLSLERCRQCDANGWGLCRREGRCVIEDDFPSVVDKIDAADLVVFANPVYFGDLSESLRAFLDRYRRISHVRLIGSGRGAGGFPQGGGTPVIGICYAGGSGNGTISCIASLERVLQMCGFDIIDMVPARRQNLEHKLPILEMTGKWLATGPTSGPPWIPPSPENSRR